MEMVPSGNRESQFNIARALAVVLYLGASIMYLFMAYTVTSGKTPAPQSMILLALLAIALVNLSMSFILPNLILRKSPNLKTQKNPSLQYWIIRMAMVESIFIFGLAYVLITSDIQPIYYFYGIGAVGVLMHWPTRERFDAIADQLEAK